MKRLIIFLALIFISIPLIGCDFEIDINTTVSGNLTELPAPKCRHEAVYLASWIEDWGYECYIYRGLLNGEPHAQAGFIYDDGEFYWLRLIRKQAAAPIKIKEISGWEPYQNEKYTKYEYLRLMDLQAQATNFYGFGLKN